MTVLKQETYTDPSSVLFSQAGLRHLKDVTIDVTELTTLYGAAGKPAVIPAGTFIAKMPSGNLSRPYPRLVCTVAATTGDAVLTVNGNPGIFKVGDQLLNHSDSANAVGTIQAIDTETGVITLAANAAVAVDVDEVVGLADARIGVVEGFLINDHDVGSPTGTDVVSIFVGATVHAERLPYSDSTLENLFPELQTV